jgi:hypothetical protein
MNFEVFILGDFQVVFKELLLIIIAKNKKIFLLRLFEIQFRKRVNAKILKLFQMRETFCVFDLVLFLNPQRYYFA